MAPVIAKHFAALVVLMLLLSLGCSISTASESSQRELVVFAASSLTESFQGIAAKFETDNPGTTVTLNFAGSQRLRTQLEQGAEADVFASANWMQMNAVVDADLTQGEAVSFATNYLVVIVTAENSHINTLEDLTRPGIKLVLAQASVPVGAYSRTAIENLADSPQYGAEFSNKVLDNLVSEETNVRNVAQKVALGEADAGIVYHTDAITPDIAQHVRIIPIPDESNVIASYPVVALKESGQPELSQEFINFVLSDSGQGILATHGFGPAQLSDATEGNQATVGANDQ